MARLLPKRSSTPGAVPTTSDLVDHELAVNTADRRVFMRAGADVVEIARAAPSFVALTQTAFDALDPPDAGTLYLIVDGPTTGSGATWLQITSEDYGELDPPDAGTLYVVVDAP